MTSPCIYIQCLYLCISQLAQFNLYFMIYLCIRVPIKHELAAACIVLIKLASHWSYWRQCLDATIKLIFLKRAITKYPKIPKNTQKYPKIPKNTQKYPGIFGSWEPAVPPHIYGLGIQWTKQMYTTERRHIFSRLHSCSDATRANFGSTRVLGGGDQQTGDWLWKPPLCMWFWRGCQINSEANVRLNRVVWHE